MARKPRGKLKKSRTRSQAQPRKKKRSSGKKTFTKAAPEPMMAEAPQGATAVGEKPEMSTLGLVVLFTGWFLAITFGLAAGGIYLHFDKSISKLKTEHNKTITGIETQMTDDKRRVKNDKKQLADAVVAHHKQQLTLRSSIARENAYAIKMEKSIKQSENTIVKLRENLGTIEEHAQQKQDDYDKIAASLEKLQKERQAILDEYSALYKKLLDELKTVLKEDNPKKLVAHFHLIRDTPLGAMPAFHAAEHLFSLEKELQTREALLLYKEVARRYPDSEHAKASRKRIAQIEDFKRFNGKRMNLGIEPYKALDVVEGIK